MDEGDYEETYIIPTPVNAEAPALAKNRRTRRKMKLAKYIKEANYATSKETMLTTVAKCKVKMDREPLSAVIDNGAATSIITKKLMRRLGMASIRSQNSS